MIVMHGYYPFVVWAATPLPRRLTDDLSRSIDVLWHLQTGTANGQARVHKASEGRFGGFEAAPFESGSAPKAYVSSRSCDASVQPYATAVRSEVTDRSQGAGWAVSQGHSRKG